MASFSEAFDTNPSTRWTMDTSWYGNIAWDAATETLVTNTSGVARCNTDLGSATQYVCYELRSNVFGLAVRMGATPADGWYQVYGVGGGGTQTAYVARYNDTGKLDDLLSASWTSPSTGDKIGVTVTNRGTSTIIRVWKNPTATAPVIVNGWDATDDTADLTFAFYEVDAGGPFYDAGQFVGLGYGALARFDNATGGSVAPPQYARPNSDITDGNWVNALLSNVNLYANINEEVAEDDSGDYIKSAAVPDADTCVVGLSTVVTPGPGPVTMRVRAKFLDEGEVG